MQTIRTRTPTVYRVTRAVPIHYNNTRTMSFFPRFAAGEFAPLFRLLDDYATHQVSRSHNFPSFPTTTLRSFQPRFDVKEVKEAYELKGELPGIDQKDIAIEFTDVQTLSIRGRTERSEERGTRPAATEGTLDQARITEADNNSGYHKPSVEDETVMAGANPDAASESVGQATPTSTEASSNEVVNQQQTAPQPQKAQESEHRYWVSERSVGEFQRTFNFPTRVDQDNVRASLKNGILSIVVPKAQAPVSRRIAIE